MLDKWLDRAYTFNPVWEYDEENKLWSVTLPEIRLYTDAPTKEDAAQQLVCHIWYHKVRKTKFLSKPHLCFPALGPLSFLNVQKRA